MELMVFLIPFLEFGFHLATASCYLQFKYTAITRGTNFPEFSAVDLLNGEEFEYYDSNIKKVIPKIQTERNKNTLYRTWQTQVKEGYQDTFNTTLIELMKYFRHTEGVHTLQWTSTCELHNGIEIKPDQYSYDGDSICVDQNPCPWNAANDKAVTTNRMLKIPKAKESNRCTKDYLETACRHYTDDQARKVPPEVTVFQKDSSSPVVCHATGFFPRGVNISWQRNGEDLHNNVNLTETLPNHNGTFQKRSILTVSPEELKNHKYTCVVQHSALERDVVRPFYPGGVSVGVIVGVVVSVLLLVLIGCVGFFIWRKKKKNASAGESSITSSLKTLQESNISDGGSSTSSDERVSDASDGTPSCTSSDVVIRMHLLT
ncbi:class I histocompatibility antigen, B alpha chain-like [Brachyhypopomus gauderio]|uniref:class I histocompatibility antigen, B alpha chain-like n=1 Tax=Brachyhypopomus gauderio TaxID=698409 RepID=UPI004041891E